MTLRPPRVLRRLIALFTWDALILRHSWREDDVACIVKRLRLRG